MHFRALILFAAALALPSVLAAQHPAPASPARIAGIAPPPAAAPVNPPSNFGASGPVFFANIPVVVFADGRVFADFGFGYEQVVRSCTLPVSYGSQFVPNATPVQPSVVQPTVVQPSIAASPQTVPYSQPVPAQQTASQQMAVQNTQPAARVVNTQSCWAVGTTGRVFVGRP
jgi:hypothetical protein